MKMRLISIMLILLLGFGVATTLGQDTPVTSQTFEPRNINNLNPFQEFPFSVDQDGSTIILDVAIVGDNIGNLDTYLYLVDDDGAIIAENDDRVRGDLTSRIEYPQAEAGNYTAIVTRYGVANGVSYGEFQLTLEISSQTATIDLQYDVSPEAIREFGFPDLAPQPQADWTVLAYYGGDNNLEWGLQYDFNEFELAGGSSESIRVLMLFDRSPENSPDNGDWRTLRLFEITADVSADDTLVFPPTIDTEPIVDFGVVDSGRGDVLAKFLSWGVRQYPAQNYAISLASHGAGWQGIITDDTAAAEDPAISYSIVTVPELSEAFRLATEAAGVEKFDLLINDACSMSSIEYFAGVSPYFGLSLASPEIVVDPALDMTIMVNQLRANPQNVDLLSLSVDLVDKYIEEDMLLSGDPDVAYFSHAVTDLNQFDPVVQAVENFAAVFNRDPERYAEILGEARVNTYTYTFFSGSTTKVDLGSLMRLVIQEATAANEVALIEPATQVLNALEAAIVHNNAGANVSNDVAYYNIFFPEESSRFQTNYFQESGLAEWGRMLRNYYNEVTPQVWAGTGLGLEFHPPKAPEIIIANVYPDVPASVLDPFQVRYQIAGRNISHADATYDFISDTGEIVRLGNERLLFATVDEEGRAIQINDWDEGVIDERYSWDVVLPVATDGTNFNNELITITEDVAFLDARYRAPGDETFNDVTVIFENARNVADNVGRTLRVINRATGSNALAAVRIPEGSEFVTFRNVVTADGRVVQEPGNTYTWPAEGLTYTEQPAPNGQYNVGLLVQAFGGTTGYASQTVTVNNDGLFDSGIRGETGLAEGFTLTRPAGWSYMTLDTGRLIYTTQNFEGNANINVYFAFQDIDPNNLETVVDFMYSFYFPDQTWDRQYTETTVDGQPAIEFNFTYPTETGTVQSRAFAVYNADLGVGFVFAAETANNAVDLEPIYQQLKANTRIFSPVSLNESRTAEWDFSYFARSGRVPFTPEVDYPIPRAWVPTQDAPWTRYAPANDPDGPTFFATSIEQGTDVNTALDLAVSRNVLFGMEGYNAGPRRTLNGQYHTWTAQTYDVTRAGQVYQGRIYGTVENGQVYLIWMEAPDGEDVATVYTETFEPIVDGFIIYPPEAE